MNILFLFLISDFISTIMAKYIILTSHFPPMVECKIGERSISFKGIDMDYFRLIAKELKWSDNDWECVCIDFSNIEKGLEDLQILGYIGGITVTQARVEKGYRFSQPTMNTGLTILVKEAKDPWMFIKVFSWEIGLLILITVVLLSILFFIFERKRFSLGSYLWNNLASIFFITNVRIYRTSSRIVMVSFWFMCLIIISTYTAYMTSIMTVEALDGAVSSPDDLNGKIVKSFTLYFETLYNYDAKPVESNQGYPNLGIDDITSNMVEYDLSRTDDYKVDAFVLDDPFAAIIDNSNCDIFMKSRVFETFTYAIMYNVKQNNDIINNIDIIIESLNEKITSGLRLSQYISENYKDSECIKDYVTDQITIKDTQGLWIILVGVAGLSIIVFFLPKIIDKNGKIEKFLLKHKIIEDEDRFRNKKVGDELVVDNLKEVTNKIMLKLNEDLGIRLDEMEDKVTKFYGLLINDNNLKNSGLDLNSFISINESKEIIEEKENLNKLNTIKKFSENGLEGHASDYAIPEEKEGNLFNYIVNLLKKNLLENSNRDLNEA